MTQLTTTASPVMASHTEIPSPTSTIHVGDWSTTSTSHFEEQQSVVASHAWGITLVSMSHTNITCPTYIHHVGDEPPASASHAESMSPTMVDDVGGIHTTKNPRHVIYKPGFLCRICEGCHLTHLCPTTVRIPKVWSSPRGPSGSELSLVSQHSISPLIDMTIMPMQSSPNPNPIFEGDASPGLIGTHSIKPTVE
jgi:hypothetical protein